MGSIKVGKDADMVLWTDNPLSVYARVLYTLVDGIIYFDYNKDKEMNLYIDQERNRIIQRMISTKKNGEPTQKVSFTPQRNYHCMDEEYDY